PRGDNTPFVFLAVLGPLIDAPIDLALDHDGGRRAADRVVTRPPRADAFDPCLERVPHAACDVERHSSGLAHRPRFRVISATMRNRVAAAPHTVSKYSRTAASPSSSRW